MKTIYSCNGNFRIGRVGENNACEVFIPKEGFADIYGAGVYTLVYDRPDGECYECPVEGRSAFIVWRPTAADTAVAGRGHIELVYRAGEVVAKGKIYDILIDISLSAAGEAPETEPEVYVFPAAETADGARLARLCQKTIFIGRVGENKATVANVRKGPEMASYEGAFGLLFQRPGEEAPYLVEAVDKGEYLEWIITNIDTAIPGRGKLQMIYSGNGTVAKGDIYDTMCDVSLDGPGDPPEPWSGYVEEVLEAAAKIENMTASASVTSEGEPGVVVTKTETGDSYNLDFAFTGIGAETALEMNLNSITLDDGKVAYLFVAANVSSAEELAVLNPTLVRLNYAGKTVIFYPPYQKSITGTIRRNAEDWSSYTLDFGELGRINNTGTLSVRIPQAMMSRFTATNANELTLRTWAQVFSAETQAQMRQNIGAASESDLQDHVDNDNIHVTAADKNIWDAKYSLPRGGIPKSDLARAVQDALTNAETIVECVYDTTSGTSYKIKSLNTSGELKELNPTLMRFKWNHSDPTNTTSFDRYAVAAVKRYNLAIGVGFALDFGEYGCYLAASSSLSLPVVWTLPISKFEDYFDSAASTSAVRVWSQSFSDENKAQARTNIGAASASDLTAHTGDTDIHVTAQEKAGWDSKYTLPSGGIPEVDLSQDVQTKLNAATSAAVFVAEASFTDWSTAQTFTLNRTSNELFSILENASDREQGLDGVFYVNIDGYLFVEPATVSMMRFLTQRIMVFTIGPAMVPFAIANIVPNDNPMQVVVPVSVLRAVFDPQADIDQLVRTIPQSLATSQKVQARTNIDVPSTSDLTNHTGNSTIHVTAADKSSWNAKYTKPSTGIPASDLAADVIPDKTSDLTNDGADGTSTYVEADELAAVATSGSYNDLSDKPTIPSPITDYVHTGNYTTAQYRKGGLVIGAANASEAGGVNVTNGRIYVTGVSNPLFGLKSSDTGATQFFLQVTRDKLYVGPTSTMALDFNGADGKVVMPNDITVKGKIIKNGGTSSQFLKADGSVDSTTYSTFDGDYNSLSNRPTIPTNTSDLTNDGSDGTSVYVEADELAAVATSGSYNDLSNKPTIPAAQVNSDWNATSGVAEILNKPSIPTKTSDLTNDSGYVNASQAANAAPVQSVNGNTGAVNLTAADVNALPDSTVIPSKTSDLTNDSDFITETAVDTKLEAKADSAGASANYAAKLTASIPYGECDSTSTATAFTATVPGITELRDGVCMLLKNGVVTSASGFTININGLGAKGAYTNLAAATRDTTLFNINYTMFFIYSEDIVSGGAWICYRGYDANTNTIGYQVRVNSGTLPMQSVTYRYRLLFTAADQAHFVPATNSTSTNATATRTVCQDAIDPFGPIVYYGATASVAAGSRPSAAVLWQQYVLNLGYSFNRSGAALTLDDWKPVYVKAAPQTDGSAVIDSTTPYVQALPTAADGKIYIYLGIAYSATNIELNLEHPVYYHDGSGIRLWTGKAMPAGLPAVTSADNGKVLQVVNGVWAAATIPNANGVSF